MKTLFDTSVLVAGMVETHPKHGRTVRWLTEAKHGVFEFLVAAHSLAELYAVLTTLPLKPRISPGAAWRLIDENVVKSARIISLSVADYRMAVKRSAEIGIVGGATYDALIARAAEKSGAGRLLTLNPDDFKRVWLQGAGIICVP